MDPEMWAILSPGIFALGGVLLSGILALAGYRLKARQDLEKELLAKQFERRLQAYQRAVEIASAFYQTGTKPITLEDVRGVNSELLLIAPPKVMQSFNRIWDTSAEKLQKAGMQEDDIKQKQTEVAREFFNAIRVDLYPWQERLPPEYQIY